MVTRRDFIRSATYAAAVGAVNPIYGSSQADPAKTTVFALLGCAHIHTPTYIKILTGSAGVSLRHVWDHDQARAARYANEVGLKAASDLEAIWSDRDVKAVVICSENNLHHDLVIAAAKAGKHIFVEKPMATKALEAYEMAAAVENANVLFTTGYSLRGGRPYLFLKNELAQGNLGKVTQISGWFSHHGALEGWFDTDHRWMTDMNIAGVGGFGDVGIHALDILMWLMGDVESVAADIKSVTGRFKECDETGEALVRFANGASGTVAAGWVQLANPISLILSGTEGHALILNNELFYTSTKVAGADGKKPWVRMPRGGSSPLGSLIDAVGGATGVPLVGAREAADRISVMEAMYSAARDHAWVTPRLVRP